MTAHVNNEQIGLSAEPQRHRTRGTAFLLLVILVFGLVFAYLVHGLAGPIRLSWVRILISGLIGAGILATLSVPLISRRRDSEKPGLLRRAIPWVAGAGMGGVPLSRGHRDFGPAPMKFRGTGMGQSE